MSAEDVIRGIDAVLVTHTHSDHWDLTAQLSLSTSLSLASRKISRNFARRGLRIHNRSRLPSHGRESLITRTGGQHGTGEIAKALAPVSGFVLQAQGEPKLYIAGDTIWCAEVEQALGEFHPATVVLNAGGARFLEGDPITMTPDDVIAVCRKAPKAQVIAVHMEAINHCLVTRDDLAFQLEAARVREQVAIPADGEWVQR